MYRPEIRLPVASNAKLYLPPRRSSSQCETAFTRPKCISRSVKCASFQEGPYADRSFKLGAFRQVLYMNIVRDATSPTRSGYNSSYCEISGSYQIYNFAQ